jgi:DNA primase
MEIQEIKSKLTISEVIKYYGLKADKQNRLKCPFHDDKTPSMQLYYKTQTAFCFSSNCKINGKAVDVIDFILHKEDCTKHEAIKKAIEIIGGENKTIAPVKNHNVERAMFLERMFTYFKNAVHNSPPAKEYLQSRCIDFKNTEVGYNAGQFHHGTRKDEALIKSCIKYGILLDLGTKGRTGNPAYKPFGKWGIVFPLKNEQNQIVSLYFRSTLSEKKQRHFYLRERQGLYPNYPKPTTKRLILTESIIDAATLLEQEKIKSNYEILSLFGTNGLTEEHQKAIKDLQELEEIIFFLNGDQAGIKAVEKYAPMLKGEYPNIIISNVAVPENEDVNSLLQGHSGDILNHLVNTRKEYDFLFCGEPPQADIFLSNEKEKPTAEVERLDTQLLKAERVEAVQEPEAVKKEIPKSTGLNTNNPYNLKYQGNEASYQIKGFNTNQLDSLKITLQIQIK